MTIEQIFQPICDKIEANPLSTRFEVKEFFYHDIIPKKGDGSLQCIINNTK